MEINIHAWNLKKEMPAASRWEFLFLSISALDYVIAG